MISRIPTARPFAFLAPAVATARTEQQSLDIMSRDPLGPVAVESACCSTTSRAPSAGTASASRRDPEAVDVHVATPRAATLVVLQSFSADWKATVDGHATDVSAADGLFQAVTVPAGDHEVALRYQPSSLLQGAVVSALGLAALLLATVGFGWTRQRSKSRAAAYTDGSTPLRAP